MGLSRDMNIDRVEYARLVTLAEMATAADVCPMEVAEAARWVLERLSRTGLDEADFARARGEMPFYREDNR